MDFDTRYFIAKSSNPEYESNIAKATDKGDGTYSLEIFSPSGEKIFKKLFSDTASLENEIKGKLIKWSHQVECAISAREHYKEILALSLEIRKKDRRALLGDEIVGLLEAEFTSEEDDTDTDNCGSIVTSPWLSTSAQPIIRTNSIATSGYIRPVDIDDDNSSNICLYSSGVEKDTPKPIKMSLGNIEGTADPENAIMAKEAYTKVVSLDKESL